MCKKKKIGTVIFSKTIDLFNGTSIFLTFLNFNSDWIRFFFRFIITRNQRILTLIYFQKQIICNIKKKDKRKTFFWSSQLEKKKS